MRVNDVEGRDCVKDGRVYCNRGMRSLFPLEYHGQIVNGSCIDAEASYAGCSGLQLMHWSGRPLDSIDTLGLAVEAMTWLRALSCSC